MSYLLDEQEDSRTSSIISPGFQAYTTTPNSAYAPLLQRNTGTHGPQPIRKIDPRYLLGAGYDLHRFSAGVQYQGGLLKAVNQVDDAGNLFSNRTSTVRFQINYRLR